MRKIKDRNKMNYIKVYQEISERLDRNYLAFGVLRFFFFFDARISAFRDKVHCSRIVPYCSCTIHGTYNHFIQKNNIKNGSHGTIYTFKNYFVTVFLVFNF